MRRLEKILCPNSIAIIGASRKSGSLGKVFLEAILRMNYKGQIYPINPKAQEIESIKAYPDIASLPEQPDLAVILLPVEFVLDTLEQLGKNGIKNVIVISAGFKEVGGEGIAREEKLVELGKRYGMNLVGPNCMGIFNTDPAVSFNGTFSPTLPNPGHVAYISQSGALGVAIMELAAQSELGFSVFVSTGNKADVNDNDVLEFLQHDRNTNVITLYLESIDKPEAFRKICGRTAALKPILAVKAGRTASGVKAASSHTGALANPEHIIDGFLKQSGVIRFDNLEDMFNAARALDAQPLPGGPRVAVITNAGGPGILASDAIERYGLELAKLHEATVKKLKKVLPAEAATANPVDMIASATHETYKNVLEIIQGDENVDSILLIIVKPPVNTTPAKIFASIEELIPNCGKTIIPVLMAQRDETAGTDICKKLQLPLYAYPESAVKSLAVMVDYSNIQQRFRKSQAIVVKPKMEEALLGGSGKDNKQACLPDLMDLLKTYDISAAPYTVSGRAEDIIKFQEKVQTKIVLKTANEQIIHKSDAGLIKTGLDSEDAIRAAFNEMNETLERMLPANVQPLFLAQKQLPGGTELVLGGKKEHLFGQVVMVGIGGIFIEALKDVAFRIAPVNAYEAREMLDSLRSQTVLDGFRGNPAIDRDAFAYTIQQFSLLLAEHQEVVEMDLNPLIWSEPDQRAVVVDVRATIG